MNPDACRDVMDRSRLPYDPTSDLGKVTANLDELSLRKQLPLRQQTNKPVLKYNTSMTKSVHLFNQGEFGLTRKELSGINTYSQNGMYYTGNIVAPTGNIVAPQHSFIPETTVTSNSHSTNHHINSQQQFVRRNSVTSNPYVRPVSATEVAANINGEKVRRMAEANAVSSNAHEKSVIANQNQALQRNSFLRPLSGLPSSKEKPPVYKKGSLTSSGSVGSPDSPAVIPPRQNSACSENSVKRLSESKATKQAMFQFASTSASPTTDQQFSQQSSLALEYTNSSTVSASKIASENSQSPKSPSVRNPSYSPNKPYVDNVSLITKQPNSQKTDINSSYSVLGQPKSVALSTASTIFVTASQQTSNKSITNAGTTAESTVTTRSSLPNDAENVASLKKMPVTNTLTGTVYYRKTSLSDNLSMPSTHSPAVAEKTDGNNLPIQKLHEHTPDTNPMKDQAPDKKSSKAAVSRPTLERSNASAQLNTKPSTQETKISVKPQTFQEKVQKTNDAFKTAKPPNGLKAGAVLNTADRSGPQQVRKKVILQSKSSSDKITVINNDKRLSSKNKIGASSNGIEQRPLGDGAPSKTMKIAEKISRPLNKNVSWDETYDEEGSDDDSSDNQDEDDDEDDVNEDEDSETVSPGERLPGDGEASFEDYDDEDDDEALDNFEDSVSDGGSDGYSINSGNSTASGRPMTAQLTRLNKQGSAELDDRIKSFNRPQTAAGNVVIKPSFRFSLFKSIPPTINFVSEGERTENLPWELRKLLKWKMSPITPIVVRTALARVGFRITKRNHDWLGCFGKHMKSQCFKSLREYQKLNHFPGSFQIGRKDKLWRNLSRMQLHHGKREFSFFPQTYVLPCDLKLLKRAWEDGSSKQKWIIKPPASARGIGIRVISKWTQIPRRRPVIVQKYLHRPYLINDSKFDMRIYVYVSSYDPLRIYVYEDGLARFASCKYSSSMKSLSNRYMHLTNYSVNKKNSEYLSNTDNAVCQGHKWSLKALWNYMKRQGINTSLIWDNIRDLIIKTIISGDSAINSMTKANSRSRYTCHELFGFDILLDESLKPWILEVNISPSLHSNSQLDINIKGGMIKDMMNIAGFRLPDERDVSSSYSSSDFSSHTPLNKYCMDKRLFTNQLAPDERAKHAYFCQKHQDEKCMTELLRMNHDMRPLEVERFILRKQKQIMQSILDTITPDDMRHLCESIDEDSRKGNFQRLFPTPHTHRYLKYFEQPRYYNLLLDQWVLRHNRMEQRGIMLLQSFCEEGIHLQNPTTNPRHMWTPPNSNLSSHRSSDMRSMGSQNSARGSGPVAPVPRILKKIPPKSGQTLSQSSSSNSLSSLVPSPQLHTPSPIGPIVTPSR